MDRKTVEPKRRMQLRSLAPTAISAATLLLFICGCKPGDTGISKLANFGSLSSTIFVSLGNPVDEVNDLYDIVISAPSSARQAGFCPSHIPSSSCTPESRSWTSARPVYVRGQRVFFRSESTTTVVANLSLRFKAFDANGSVSAERLVQFSNSLNGGSDLDAIDFSPNNGQFGNGALNNGQFGNGALNNGQFGNGVLNNGQFGNGVLNNGQFGNGALNNGGFNNNFGQDPFLGQGLGGQATYSGQISIILNNKCIGCHRFGGMRGSSPLDSYQNAQRFGQAIVARTADGTMPPGQPLSVQEINLLRAWQTNGFR